MNNYWRPGDHYVCYCANGGTERCGLEESPIADIDGGEARLLNGELVNVSKGRPCLD